MTNEQLAALLKSYVDRLHIELDALSDKLPDGLERNLEWCHKEGAAIADSELLPVGDYVVLDGLYRFVSDIEDAIEVLVKGDK